MVSLAHTAQLNAATLISLSASSLQANIYQLIGLKAAPLGGSTFWRQLNMAQAYNDAEFQNKGQSPSLTLASCAWSGVWKKLLILFCDYKEYAVVTGKHNSLQSLLNA